MPTWAQVFVSLGALYGAISLLWVGVLRPLIRLGAGVDVLERRVDDLERRVRDLEEPRPPT